MNARSRRRFVPASLAPPQKAERRYAARIRRAVVTPLRAALLAEVRPVLRALAAEARADAPGHPSDKATRVVGAIGRAAARLAELTIAIEVADIGREIMDRAWSASRRAIVAAGGPRTVIDIGLSEAQQLQLSTWAHEQAQLVTSLVPEAFDRLASVVSKQVREGTEVRTIARIVGRQFDVTSNRAILIARTETAKLNARVSQDAMKRAGATRYVWHTAGDERVRGDPSGLYPNPSSTGRPTSDHYILDGQTFAFDNPPVIDVTGIRGNPGEIWNCRCVAEPVFDDEHDNAP